MIHDSQSLRTDSALDITQRFMTAKKGAFKRSSFVGRVTPRRMHQPYAAHFTIERGKGDVKGGPTEFQQEMQC